MSKSTSSGSGLRFDSFVPNTAAIDTYTAPDSTALRPNPGALGDRPRKANQTPSSAVEADLPKE